MPVPAFYGTCGGGGRVLTAVALQTLRALVLATLFRSIAGCDDDDDDVDQDDCDGAESAAAAGRSREVSAWIICASINFFALMVFTRRRDLTRCGLCWEKHINCTNPCLYECHNPAHLQTEPKMWCSGGTNTSFTRTHAGCATGVYCISTICFGGLIGWNIAFWLYIFTPAIIFAGCYIVHMLHPASASASTPVPAVLSTERAGLLCRQSTPTKSPSQQPEATAQSFEGQVRTLQVQPGQYVPPHQSQHCAAYERPSANWIRAGRTGQPVFRNPWTGTTACTVAETRVLDALADAPDTGVAGWQKIWDAKAAKVIYVDTASSTVDSYGRTTWSRTCLTAADARRTAALERAPNPGADGWEKSWDSRRKSVAYLHLATDTWADTPNEIQYIELCWLLSSEVWWTSGAYDLQSRDSRKLFLVDKSSVEFSTIAERFNATMQPTASTNAATSSANLPGYEVVRLERVENGFQHQAFKGKLAAMQAYGDFDPRTMRRLLFHGTRDPVALRNICTAMDAGFLPLLSGSRHGEAYGSGCYFARDASYSHSYSAAIDPIAPSLRQIILADVAVGHCTQGRAGLKAGPVMPSHFQPAGDGAGTRRYNSFADTVDNPSIFVVPHSSQAYPAYVITYAPHGTIY